MRKVFVLVLILLVGLSAGAEIPFSAGAAAVSITPLEAGIPTPLGGYGAREGKPAEGVHDTLMAKCLIIEWPGQMCAVVTLDVCSAPVNALEESLAKAGIEGLSVENVLMAASHSHAGIEGLALDRRNISNNPKIGIFSEELLAFVTDRIALGLQEAKANMRPARIAAGVDTLTGMTANRRGDEFVDDDLTVLRIDDMDGKAMAVLVNFTAHGTIMTEKEMLTSGGWSGVMQRTVETMVGGDAICLYTNGAEGDIRPAGAEGGSRWEMAEDFGRRVGIAAADVANQLETHAVDAAALAYTRVTLPEKRPAPDFVAIAGQEYGVSEKEIGQLVQHMWPDTAPLYVLRLDDFAMSTYPGEAICQLGLAVKRTLRDKGIAYPCVSGLTSDYIGYILTKDEYHQSGYEATVSFYGDALGDVLLTAARNLAVSAVSGNRGSESAQQVKIEEGKNEVRVLVNGEPFTTYTYASTQKYPYFWPVNGPKSKLSLTTESSEPYPHHHSLFFGCDKVNGANFWQDENAAGQILSQGSRIESVEGARVSFTDTCLWQKPGEAPVMRDTRRVVIEAPSDALRFLDFSIELEALVPVEIQNTNHSLFSVRMAPEMSVEQGGVLVNREGKRNQEGTQGVVSDWCDYSNTRNGHTEGVAIFVHPSSDWYPTPWSTRDYGFFSPTPLNSIDQPVALAEGEKVALHYRVVVHAGDADRAEIANLYSEYAASAPVSG